MDNKNNFNEDRFKSFKKFLAEKISNEEIKNIIPDAQEVVIPPRVVVINEGENNDALYFILSGRMRIFISDQEGRVVTLSALEAGDYFGEIVLDGGRRTASIEAATEARLLIVPGPQVGRLLKDNHDFTLQLLASTLKKVRGLSHRVREFALLTVYGRFTSFLDEHTVKQEDGTAVLTPTFTLVEIAQHISASREMVSRLLHDLVEGGYIRREKRQIIVLRKLPAQW